MPIGARRIRFPFLNWSRRTTEVDVVVAWVDGQDEAHRAKRNRFLEMAAGKAVETVATKARRFSDNDEIRYCLRSIRNHAPWVRTIWLLTDNQVPASIDPDLARREGIQIVDHREIFRGYERMLPTFNSLALETFLWRIRGLSDHFLYLNDDMMFVGPVERSTFFSEEGKLRLRGAWADWSAKPDADISFHGANKLLGAEMMGYSRERFFSPIHVVYPMSRPAMERLFRMFKLEFLANAAYRFRDREQFWPISLQNHLLLKEGAAEVIEPIDALHFSVKLCRTGSMEVLTRRLRKLGSSHITMTCVNYLEAVVEKVPDAMNYLDTSTGPSAAFERSPPSS